MCGAKGTQELLWAYQLLGPLFPWVLTGLFLLENSIIVKLLGIAVGHIFFLGRCISQSVW
jgi:hypothetical protein